MANKSNKWAVGALVAGAAGYIAGILTAPKSGKETRQEIAEKSDELKMEAEQKLLMARDELDEVIKSTKDKATGLPGKAREEYNEAVVRAKDAKNKTAYLLKAAKAGEADDPNVDKAIRQAKQAGKNLKKFLKS